MKFSDHAALVMHTTRLQAASAAMVACDAAMKEQNQVFDFAGQRFTGPDAYLLKRVLFEALGGIAEEATDALKRGGISFEGMEGEGGKQPAVAKKVRKKAA